MNPFDLRGPQFLGFYFSLSVITIILFWLVRRMRERTNAGYGGSPMTDPYLIAFLRGDKNELLRVAMISLIDRGLMLVDRDAVQTTTIGRESLARKRIERELLEFCVARREPKEIFEAKAFELSVAEYELELSRMRLLPDDAQKEARWKLYVFGVAILAFFAITKIVVALSRGRPNVVLLIVLLVFAVLMLAAVVFQRRTSKGDAFIAEVRNLFQSLKLRAPQIRSGGATTELAMLTAVWGVAVLPKETFPWVRNLFPRVDAASTSGSSCGSSCGSGCGGGCGGGGCGGCGG